MLHTTSSSTHHGVLCFSSLVSAAHPWSAMATTASRAVYKYGEHRHDVCYDEAREGASRDGRRPADYGMPGDGVPFQENAGYEEDTDG